MHKTHPRYLAKVNYTHHYSSDTYHTYDSLCAEWSPDSELVISGGMSGVLIANDRQGDERWRSGGIRSRRPGATRRGGQLWTYIRCLAHSPDGNLIAVGTFDHQVALFDVAQGKRLALWSRKGTSVDMLSVAWSPDSSKVAFTTSEKRLYLWELAALERGDDPEWSLGIEGNAVGVAFDRTGKYLTTFGSDGILRSRSIENRRKSYIIAELDGRGRFLDKKVDEFILTTSAGVYLLDGERHILSLGDADTITGCWLGDSRQYVALQSKGGEVKVRSRTGEQIERWLARFEGDERAFRLAASPDGERLLILGKGVSAYLARTEDIGTDVELEQPPVVNLFAPLEAALAAQPASRADTSHWYRGEPLDWDEPGEELWRRELPSVQTVPFIADKKHVYLAAASSCLGALDVRDGSIAWFGPSVMHCGGTVAQSPGGWLAGARVVCLTSGMLAFDEDGKTKWRSYTDIPNGRARSPIAMGDVILDCSRLYHRAAFNARTGFPIWCGAKRLHDSRSVAWSKEGYFLPRWGNQKAWFRHGEEEPEWALQNTCDEAPLWLGEHHIIAPNYSDLRVYDVRDGSQLWAERLPNKIEHFYLFQNERDQPVILCLLRGGELQARSAHDGELLWGIEAPKEGQQEKLVELTLVGDRVLVPRGDELWVIDVPGAELCFKQPVGATITAPVVSANNCLYIACAEGLLAIARSKSAPLAAPSRAEPAQLESGARTWSNHPRTESHHKGLLGVDISLVLLADRSALFALSTRDGRVIWRVETGANESASGCFLGQSQCIVVLPVGHKTSNLAALDKRDGRVLWSRPLHRGYRPEVFGVWNGALLLALGNDLLGIAPETGEERWRIEGIVDEYHPKVRAAGEWMVTEWRKHLRCYGANLKEAWSLEDAGDLLAVGANRVLMLRDGACVAHGLADGEVVWTLSSERAFIEAFFEPASGHFILKTWARLFRVDGEDGVIVWEREHGMESRGQIAMADGMVCLHTSATPGLFGFEFSTGDAVELEQPLERLLRLRAVDEHLVGFGFSGEIACFEPRQGWPETPWRMPHHVPETTMAEVSEVEVSITDAPVVIWIAPLGVCDTRASGLCLLESASGKKRLVMCSRHLGVCLLEPSTGEVRWRSEEVRNAKQALPFGDMLAVMSSQDKIFGLEIETGAVRWVANVPASVLDWAVGVEHIVVLTKEQCVWWIDTTGQPVGFVALEHPCQESTEIDLERGVIFSSKGAFDLSTGKRLWEEGKSVISRLGVAIEDVCLREERFKSVNAHDVRDGASIWQVRESNCSNVWITKERLGERAFFMLGSNYNGGSAHVICVDVRDGSELWRVKTGKGADCAPALVGEVVLACEYEGAIRALDARSGELLWRRDLPEGTRSPVQILAHDEGIAIADISGMIVHMGWPE